MTTTPDFAPVEDATTDRAPATVEQLEQEGDIAADFIEGLLDIADIDGDLDLVDAALRFVNHQHRKGYFRACADRARRR